MRTNFTKRIGLPPVAPRTVMAGLDALDVAAMGEGLAIGQMRRKMAVTANRPPPKRQACKGKRNGIPQGRGCTEGF